MTVEQTNDCICTNSIAFSNSYMLFIDSFDNGYTDRCTVDPA